MQDHIKIRTADGKWVIRACGAVLAESDQALELAEGDAAPVIYFPRADIAMALLEPTDSKTKCPYKGEANYFTIQGHSGSIEDAAWSYEDPIKGVAKIKGHLAFYTTKVKVERL